MKKILFLFLILTGLSCEDEQSDYMLRFKSIINDIDEERYYLSCKVYSIGSGQIDSYDDNNNGEGYSLFEAKVKADVLHNLESVDGHLNGTAVNIYSYNGDLILEN